MMPVMMAMMVVVMILVMLIVAESWGHFFLYRRNGVLQVRILVSRMGCKGLSSPFFLFLAAPFRKLGRRILWFLVYVGRNKQFLRFIFVHRLQQFRRRGKTRGPVRRLWRNPVKETEACIG